MSKLQKIFLGLVAMLMFTTLTGCDDKVAEDLADQLKTVATTYQEQVQRTAKAEQTAYQQLAATYVSARQTDQTESLAQERIERGGAYADQVVFVDKAPPLLSDLQRQLHNYAEADFALTKALMQDESEAHAAYLSLLNRISVDNEKIEALSKSFASLAKRNPSRQQLTETVNYWREVKTEIDSLICRDLTEGIKAQTALLQSLQTAPSDETPQQRKRREAKRVVAQSKLDLLNSEAAEKNCPPPPAD